MKTLVYEEIIDFLEEFKESNKKKTVLKIAENYFNFTTTKLQEFNYIINDVIYQYNCFVFYIEKKGGIKK